jgi:hypothetical protein
LKQNEKYSEKPDYLEFIKIVDDLYKLAVDKQIDYQHKLQNDSKPESEI